MSPLARRLWTLLPPLVVLGGLAALFLRASRGTDARDRAEAAIRTRWEAPSEFGGVRRDLSTYYDRYGADPAGRWFAIEAYARIGDTASAFDVWNRKPEAARERGSVRRLADVLLRALARVPGLPGQPSVHEPRVLQALTEGGDAAAEAQLAEKGRTVAAHEVVPLYGPIHRSPTRAARVLSEALLANTGSLEAPTAGAVIASNPKDRSHVAFLAARLDSPWKFERLFMWQHIARALGAAGGPEATAALRAEWAATKGATDPQQVQLEQVRKMGLDAGLVLAGDPAAKARLFPSFVRTEYEMASLQLALGWTAKWQAGDPDAVAALVDLWARAPGRTTRLQIAMCCFLSDEMPPAGMPCDTWADDLAHETGSLPRALAHIWHFRRGVAGAVDTTAHDFDVAVHALDLARAVEAEGDSTSTAMEILRAWYRWGGAP